ncbi:OLC1v1013118C1 [Oldenlandia corymbosa var. corymbosa]|uniref:OLC1v1013118C1 n=1 Tax=Oldenlandia corymbosa var. corymbosa TaxID=529605 RepID=A0AAV1E0Q7_OLDCO|nr:OLC1v1013118C1 [Oldenlandia corymbosa var. corymbosa]
MPDDSFVIDHKLLYNDLVGLICERVGWNRKNVNLSLSILYDTMRNGFRRIAKIKDDASLQVLYFLPSSTYIDLYVDLEVAGTSRSHLEVGTTSGRPNVENVDYMEDDDAGGPFMEDGDHMEYNHGKDDEDYTSISDQSDKNQSISEESRESDEEVEDKFATKDRHIYRSQGACFKNKEEAKNGIAAWNIEQKREFYVKKSDDSTWSIWCKSLKESTPKGYVPCRWKVRASLRDHDLWEIVKWVPEHNCMNVTEENNNWNLSATLIAHLIRHKVELDPDYEVKLVQEEVKDRMHVDVPYHRAWEGRRKAIDLVYGDWVSIFDILPSNLVAQFRSKKIKRLCWEMGTKLSKSKFKELRNELRDFSNDAYLYLEEIDACQWTLAKDKHYRWGNQTMNISESYNNVLKGVRFLPIRALVEATFIKTVDLFQEEYMKSRKCITPVPTDLWEDFKKKEKKAAQHKVNRYGTINGKFKVKSRARLGGLLLGKTNSVGDDFSSVPDMRRWPKVGWRLVPNYERVIMHAGPGRWQKKRFKMQMDYRGRKSRGECLRCGSRNHFTNACPKSQKKSDRTRLKINWDADGLKVDGKPVEGMTPENSMAQWMALCFGLLGITPVSDMFDGNKIYAECLINECLRPIPENAPREAYTQRARALLLLLIGGFLIPDNTGNRIPLWILTILEDLDVCATYSWGSAVLAKLYFALCQASAPGKKDITGCYMLMQLWVWERIPRLQPKRKVKDESYLVPDAPLGNSEHRRSLTWIFCWAIRKPYEPNRVLRQFQCVQTVPEYPLINDIDRWNAIHHGCLGTGKAYDDWVQKHTESLNLSDIYHLADVALRENPSLGGSLEDKLFQIFNKSFSALTLGPRDMSTQSDTQVLQKRPPESSQNVVLTQKTTSKPTEGGRRKRPGISDRTIIVHPNPTSMQEDDENDEGNESDEDYYIRGEEEEEEEEEESSPPRVSSQKKKKTVEVRKSDRVSKPAKKYTPGDGATRKKRSSK